MRNAPRLTFPADMVLMGSTWAQKEGDCRVASPCTHIYQTLIKYARIDMRARLIYLHINSYYIIIWSRCTLRLYYNCTNLAIADWNCQTRYTCEGLDTTLPALATHRIQLGYRLAVMYVPQLPPRVPETADSASVYWHQYQRASNRSQDGCGTSQWHSPASQPTIATEVGMKVSDYFIPRSRQ